jgi:hypothetical protein
MAFMTARVSDTRDYFLTSEDLEECVFCKYNSIGLPVGVYSVDDEPPSGEHAPEWDTYEDSRVVFMSLPQVNSFEIVYKFWGQLSASGYMDQTDYVLGDTQAEVAQQLLDMYFDGEDEYMDDEERADREWLESIVEGEGA